MTQPYYAAACQTDFACPRDRSEIAERTRRMCDLAEYAIAGYAPLGDVRLLVFPEFAHAAPIYDSIAKLRARLAVPVPNEHIDRYASLCRKHGCYIQTGTFIEADPRWPGVLFNTTALVGPSGMLARYRKINPWLPWELHASPHDLADYPDDPFPVVETELGCLAAAICYDWLLPETIRQLAFAGAEVLLRVSAYMDPWGATPPMDWWTLFNRVRAIENTCYVVAANQGASLAHYAPFSWPGGSMLVDYDGRILAQADPGPGEKVVVGPIDILALRAERARRRMHDMRGHLRSEIHTYLQRPYLPRAEGHPLTTEQIERRIAQGKQAAAQGAARQAAAEDRRAGQRPAGQRVADDRESHYGGADDRVADDRVADDRVAGDRGADERAVQDPAVDDRAGNDRALDDRAVDERVADDRPVDDGGATDRAAGARLAGGRAAGDGAAGPAASGGQVGGRQGSGRQGSSRQHAGPADTGPAGSGPAGSGRQDTGPAGSSRQGSARRGSSRQGSGTRGSTRRGRGRVGGG